MGNKSNLGTSVTPASLLQVCATLLQPEAEDGHYFWALGLKKQRTVTGVPALMFRLNSIYDIKCSITV